MTLIIYIHCSQVASVSSSFSLCQGWGAARNFFTASSDSLFHPPLSLVFFFHPSSSPVVLPSQPWPPSSGIRLSKERFQSLEYRWYFFYNLWPILHDHWCTLNCAENNVDLAAEVTVVFHWMVYHIKINLVTKTIMKNIIFKNKCLKGFA